MFLTFIRYFWAVFFHKCCILLAGLRINKILRSTSYRVSYRRLLLHDLSKYSVAEFWPYADYFCGSKSNKKEFQQAWIHHVHHNDHHCEHFIEDYARLINQLDQVPLKINPMPDEAILEMLADNLAASRSYEGRWPDPRKKDGWAWMTNGFHRFRLHPVSKWKFTAFLCAVGYANALPVTFDWNTIGSINVDDHERRRLLALKPLAEFNN